MRVFVAGSSGVIGRQLIPALTAAGHQVTGMARTTSAGPHPYGVRLVEADALDAGAVAAAVARARPDAVVNMLTAIPATIHPRRMVEQFRLTNRLRTEGTRNLLDAAAAAGVRQVIAQGLAYIYDPRGGAEPADEDQPLWADPPKQFVPNLAALLELERRTLAAGGLVMRYGHLYGPGTIYGAGGSFVQQVRDGNVPVVGEGRSTFSFTHTADAADAVVAALGREISGVLNVVDDEPTDLADWLPVFAGRVGGPAPKQVPVTLARLVAGAWGVAFMTRLRGADNRRAGQVLDWHPRHPTWRDTLGLADPAAEAPFRSRTSA